MRHTAHKLVDIVDIGRLQRLCDDYCEAGGMALAVLDPDGTILVSSGWQDICTQFHRRNETTMAGCLESDQRINERIREGLPAPEHIAYRCANGLWDVAYPLAVDGEHVATVFTGQFFYDDDIIEVKAFRRRAHELGLDEEGYLNALGRVPVVSHRRVERTVTFLADLAEVLGELGLARLREEQTTTALRASTEALEEAQHMAGLGRWELGLVENRLEWSPGTYEIFEIDPVRSEASYDAFLALIHPDDREAVDKAYVRSLDDRRPCDIVHRLVMKDGRIKWVHERFRTDNDSDGTPVRSVGIIQDVTELRIAEAAVSQTQKEYETFINATDDMAFLKDEELRYVIVNAANAAFFGRPVDQIIGRTDAELMTPGQAAACRDSDDAAIAGGGVVIAQEEAGGRVYETRKFPVALPGGKVGVGGYVRDITEQRRAEAEVARLNVDLERLVTARTAQLEAANKELESFAYSISHDLRAPLRALDGFSHILIEDYDSKLDEEGRSHLRRIRAAAHHMSGLMDGLLQLSRLNREELRREPVDLSSLAQEIADGLAKGDDSRVVVVAIAPGLIADADPQLIRIVLENLLGNAFKFTAHHETAHIEMDAATTDGRTAFFVRDDGAGFDMRYADKLFVAFQRLHTPDEFEGTGIGLATVQRIVNRHGGTVWAEAVVEKGATFWFTLGPGAHD